MESKNWNNWFFKFYFFLITLQNNKPRQMNELLIKVGVFTVWTYYWSISALIRLIYACNISVSNKIMYLPWILERNRTKHWYRITTRCYLLRFLNIWSSTFFYFFFTIIWLKKIQKAAQTHSCVMFLNWREIKINWREIKISFQFYVFYYINKIDYNAGIIYV